MLKPFTKFLYLLVYDNNTQWCIGVSSRADVWIHDALLGRGKHLGAADCWPGLKPLRQGVRVALVRAWTAERDKVRPSGLALSLIAQESHYR